MMAFLYDNSRPIPHWWRAVGHTLRWACCWPVVLAALLVATPGVGILRIQAVEACETEIPAEECADPLEFDLSGRSAPTRRMMPGMVSSRSMERDVADHFRAESSHVCRAADVSGHRLANGLRAPLRC